MLNLTENTKRILFVVFFVLFSIATGYALYYFFFRPLAGPAPGQEPPGYTGELGTSGPRGDITPVQDDYGMLTPADTVTEAGEQPGTEQISPDVSLLRDAVTQAASPSADGNTRYYNPEDGRFYKINADGSITVLSSRQFFNVDNVNWGNTADEAILEFPDGSNIYYSFDDQRQVTLPQHWEDFNFSPKDSQVVAKSIGLDENNRFLITTSPDGNEATALYNLGKNAQDVIPSWSPNNQVIAFSKTGSPQPDNGEQIYLLGKNNENPAALNVPGRGFVPNWSPTGKKILYSVHHQRDGERPMLWISDASGQDVGRNRQKMNLITWADKCVWANDKEIFCAVPIELPIGAGYERSPFLGIPDDIYYINLDTGVSQKINTPEQNRPVSQPIISQDLSTLIFTDSVTGKLYSYKLNY